MGMAVRLAVRACVPFAAFGRARRARRADERLSCAPYLPIEHGAPTHENGPPCR